MHDANDAAIPTPAVRRFATWRAPLLRTAFVWWGGAWAAFVFSPLPECSHCVRLYLALLPIQPGVLLATATGTHDLAFGVTASVATLAVLAGTAVTLRELGARWLLVAIPLALLATAQGIGLGHALRM